jgi:lambda family phage portal protein
MYQNGERIRIPAEQVLHLFDPEHTNQFRGISHLAPVMIDLHNLKGYDEAAIVAARVGASKTIVIEREMSDETTGDEEDSEGNQIQNLSYGEVEYLNPGEKIASWTPDYPKEQYPAFIKACYRRIAVALGMNYASLMSDLESVNFSSMRSGLLMERDQWFVDQQFIICSFLEIVFYRWLKAAQFNSLYQKDMAIDLPYNPEKYNQPEFFGRTYPWVDPFKDVQATVLALDNNLTTITRELKRQGLDFDDMLDERKYEIDKMKEAGIVNSEAKDEKRKPVDDNDDEEKVDDEEMMKNIISFVKKKSNGHFKKLVEEIEK